MKLRLILFTLTTLFFIKCNDSETVSSPKKTLSFDNQTFTSVNNSGITFNNKVKESLQMSNFVWENFYSGAGVGVGDFNNDGLQDVVFTANFGTDEIYINKGNLKFDNISSKCGLKNAKGFSSGVTVVDINKDGLDDIYICKFPEPNTKVGKNELYINNGDLTFTESAAKYGLDFNANSQQASFFDFNKDGFLDMYLVNQPSQYKSDKKKQKGNDSAFLNDNTSDCLYLNNGNNTFKNVSVNAGIRNFASGLGVITADFNEDGWTDVFVANDFDKADNLWINQKNGTFKDIALDAFDHISNFSMGTDIGDINNDMLVDIGVVDMAGADHYRSKTNMPSMSPETFWKTYNDGNHLQYMHNVLHLGQGDGKFVDVANLLGVQKTDWSWTLLINDFNNDGNDDIYVTNGIVRDIRNNDYIEKGKAVIQKYGGKVNEAVVQEMVNLQPSVPMPNYMFINDGHLHMVNKSDKLGLGKPGFSSGAAYADFDNDGDLDLIVNNTNATADVFENNANKIGNSLAIKLTTSTDKRPTLNAKATVYAGNIVKKRELINVRGFKSCSEPMMYFGLGNTSQIDSVVITWPDNNESIHTDLKINEINILDQSKIKKTRRYKHNSHSNGYFVQNDQLSKLVKHSENDFNAFERQVLLPYEPSELGPFVAKGDFNGDNKTDLVVGGSFGQPTKIMLAQDNDFSIKNVSGSTKFEDGDMTVFDADNDGDLDIFVTSSGYELTEGNANLRDRLYINNGKGNFSDANIATPRNNSAKAINYDFDNDGDEDLFVFGRVLANKYPIFANSYLLECTGKGKFEDVTDKKAGFLKSYGNITDAFLIKDKGIVTVGEWDTPKMITSAGGTLSANPINGAPSGLWFSVTGDDIDNDGDIDLVVGNFGKNSKFKATKDKPFQVYASDFDDNGKSDIVLATYYNDKVVPVRGKECSTEQLPELQEKFKTYEDFATAELTDIINTSSAQKYIVNELKSGVFWNEGNQWRFDALPIEAQLFPINDCEIADINGDGQKDLVVAGNLFAMEVETTRMDAGKGLVLIQKDGKFNPLRANESGLFAKGDAKDMVMINDGNKKQIAITMNNDYLQIFDLK